MPGCKVGDLVVVIKTDSPENEKMLGAFGTVLAADVIHCSCDRCSIYRNVKCFKVEFPSLRQLYPERFTNIVAGVPDTCIHPIHPPKSLPLDTDTVFDDIRKVLEHTK